MGYLVQNSGLIEYTFGLTNLQLQGITANVPILLQDTSGRSFSIVGASIAYNNATAELKLQSGGRRTYILIGGVLMAMYQTSTGSAFAIFPGFAISYQVNYDESGPLFCDAYRGDSIEIVFEEDYASGDGDLTIKVVGYYI
jgi:hypothetical protein